MQALLSPPLTRADRTRLRKALPWLLLALFVDVLAANVFGIPRIEADLETRSEAALAAAGFDNVLVEPLGRELLLSGTLPAGTSPTAAEELVESLRGVRYAVAAAQASPPQSTEPFVIGAASTINLATSGNQTILTGQVSSQDLSEQIEAAARAAFGPVTNELTVSADAEQSDSINALPDLASALATINQADISVTGNEWVLAGAVSSAAEVDSIAAAVVAAVPSAVIDNRLTVVDTAAAARALAELTARMAEGSLLFELGSAEITEAGAGFLDEVGALLLAAPEVAIKVGGHTDNVGSETDNLALSTQRAEAVKAYLVVKGINSRTIEAVGYGESQPIADNSTEEGRAANRRIDFEVLEGGG